MRILKSGYYILILLSFVLFGCSKPKGAKKLEGDANYFTVSQRLVPFCGPDSNWWEFLPYGEVIDSQNEFDLYFGCTDTSNTGLVRTFEPDFIDFDSYDLMLFRISKTNVLSYSISKIKIFVNDEENNLYVRFRVKEKNAGHGETDFYDYIFVEIPVGYENYEVQIIRD